MTYKVVVFCKPDWIETKAVYSSKKEAVQVARKYRRSYVLCVETDLIVHSVGKACFA